MNRKLTKPEVLSPCGAFESVKAAICAGCDAVYIGAEKFSARNNAENFSEDEIISAARECHRNGVSVYLALNTVLLEDELKQASEIIKTACEAPLDGIIIQDMAVYEIVKTACPDMKLHASTQMTVHTPLGAQKAKEMGFERVVAARELSLKTLEEMAKTGIGIEAFAHGALCMCVSGQCYLSAAIGGRSANRGMCAGACRLPFSALGTPGPEDCALSLKDLSYCKRVKELAAAGVCSLKIEGRMKRPEYVAAATDALRKAVDGAEFDENILRAVFSRSGFTDSYLTEGPNAGMFGKRTRDDVVSAEEALPKLRKIYEKPRPRFILDMKFTAAPGKAITLTATDGENEATAAGEIPEKAINVSLTAETVSAQLSKLGGTIYTAGKIEADVAEGITVPKSSLNALRRSVTEELDRARAEGYKKKEFDPKGLVFDFPMPLILKRPVLRARVRNISQLEAIDFDSGDENAVIPLSEAENYILAGYSPERAVIELPRFDTDENKTLGDLKNAKNLGFGVVECGNIGQIKLCEVLGISPAGGFGLNITNSLSARHYRLRHGIKTMLLSPELTPVQAGCIAVSAKTGITVYGRLPLAITRNCPISAQAGCRGCKRKLTDRTGAEFPVICHKERGTYEILNSRPIWLADRYEGFNLDFCDLMFTVEAPEECGKIYRDYKEKKEAPGLFTRGIKIKRTQDGGK